jgi:hypothetical protein
MHIAIIEKSTRRVFEVLDNEAASLEALQAYNGACTRARCTIDELHAYSVGKEIKANTRYGIESGPYGDFNVIKTYYTVH